MPPVAPMLAKSTDAVPEGDGWQFEPKWDGFRCIVFRDGPEIELGSRNERPLTRYFPELATALLRELPERCVVDGEIVVATAGGLDFDALQQRIHPAESRVNRLALETPASFVAFDLLALGDDDLMGLPLAERRARLEQALAPARPPVHLTPVTSDRATAQDWFVRFEGAGLDGVMAKDLTGPYVPDKRTQLKVKHKRTADCVVAGYRVHKSGDGIGSLLLGLYDDDGALHHMGVATSFTAARRKELVAEVAPYERDALADHPWRDWGEARAAGGDGEAADGSRMPGSPNRWNATKDMSWTALRTELVAEVAPYEADALAEHPWRDWGGAEKRGSGAEKREGGVEGDATRMPGSPNRWNATKDMSWTALRTELVAEVAYEHVQSGRFRHATRLVRFRPDRDPRTCTFAQLEQVAPYELHRIFGI
jgi:ATP-dependent DNA ligase